MKRLSSLFVCLFLTACGGPTGPSADEISGAVMSRLADQYEEAVRSYGAEAAEWHVIPPRAVSISSIDNVRAQDEATFLADVTLVRLKTGDKDTRPISLRKVEGAWRVVSR